MHDALLLMASAAMAFLAIMNPIGNTPIFLGLAGDQSAKAQRGIALKSVCCAFVIVAVFCVGGNLLFRTFGITLPAFRIAGGVLLFAVGYQLLHGRESAIHHPEPGETGDAESAGDVAISPLAIPILAGPGTIATAMSLVAPHPSLTHVTVCAVVIAVFAGMCALTFVCFVLGERLVSFFGPGIVKVITRLMGLLVTVIAAQMVIQGVAGAIQNQR